MEAMRFEASMVKLEAEAEPDGVVLGIPFALLFACLIAASLCSFAQSLRFLNAVAPCRKVSAFPVDSSHLIFRPTHRTVWLSSVVGVHPELAILIS